MAEDKVICVEVDGIPATIDREAAGDIEVMEMLGDMQGGNVLVLPRLMRAVFGEEQYGAIKRSLRGDSGHTSAADMARFLSKAMRQAGEQAKNS